jgi:hypothetical protein
MTGSNEASGSGLGGFSAQLTGLTQGTIYYYRAFAVNAVGVAYGENASFTTVAATIPILSTTSVTNVTSTTATAGGDISSIGGSPVTSKGVCYDTLTNPTLASNLVSGGSGPGPFSCNIFGLHPDKTYYLRAYANNASGTAYGNQVSFTTLVTQNMEIQSIDETYHIYPNPFQHEVFVERTGKEAAIRYQIINSLGMKVMDGILRPGEFKLQAGKLSPGLYTIQFAGHAGIKIRKE